MSKEGSTEAPIRHPLNFEHPDFLDPKKLDDEMRRVFDICHGCRRCFNLCDSFPKLFDMMIYANMVQRNIYCVKHSLIMDYCPIKYYGE